MDEERLGILLSVGGLILMVMGVGILSSMVGAASTLVFIVIVIALSVLGSGCVLLYRAVFHHDR